MSCSAVKMFLVPRSSILPDWAGASLGPGASSEAFSLRLADTEEEEEEVVILLARMEARERDKAEVIMCGERDKGLTRTECCTLISDVLSYLNLFTRPAVKQTGIRRSRTWA